MERMEAVGYNYKPEELNDTSEALAMRLNKEMPRNRVVWNDHRPATHSEFLHVQDFAALAA